MSIYTWVLLKLVKTLASHFAGFVADLVNIVVEQFVDEIHM